MSSDYRLATPPRAGGATSIRSFIPHRCCYVMGILGAVSRATASRPDEGPATGLASGLDGDEKRVSSFA